MNSVFLRSLGLGGALLGLVTLAGAQPAPQSERRDAVLRSMHLLSPGAHRVRTFVGAPTNRGVSTSHLQGESSRLAVASGISFSFSGYTSEQTSTLSSFLNQNLSLISQVWGDPAPEQAGKTLLISNVKGSATYFPPAATNSTAGTIEFGYVPTGSASDNQFAVLELVLRAYQGPRVPAFDFNNGSYIEPYLYGASQAAALQIAYRALGSPASFDPTIYAAYLLPVYDAFNSPALGNAFIYPQSGSLAISDFRLAMAQAAFLKINAENPDFFRLFNAALYARGAARSPISTDDLEALVAGIVPTVEGLPFRSWVREQGALNARVSTGNKLYLGVLPLPLATTAGGRSGFTLFAQAFSTASNGDETPLGGNASLDAFDETGKNVTKFSPELASSNVLSFGDGSASSSGQATSSASFNAWSSPAPARVTLRARLGATEARGVFPFSVAGATTSASSFYGATLGVNAGNLTLSSASGTQTVPVVRGTFAATLAYPSGPAVKTTISDGARSVTRNTAWLVPGGSARSVEFLLDGVGKSESSALTLDGGVLKMIAFPLRPVERDEARALGVDAASLALARYRPDLSPSGASAGGGLQFGVDGSRYEIYPRISQGPEAGRGYWIKTPASGVNTQVAGAFPPVGQNAEVELKGGWNQFGVPRATGISTLNMKVRYGGFSAVSLQEAQNRGIIAPGVWRYNGSSGYERADVAGAVLNPWEGFWIFASPSTGVNLVFEPGASSGASSALSRPATSQAGEWLVGLGASSSRLRDTSASFGVSSQTPAARPPVAARQLSVYFPATGTAGTAGSGDAQGLLTQLKKTGVWRFTVDGASKGERVTLGWPNVSNAPRGLQLVLRDDATGKATMMRSGGKLQFSSDGKPHSFSITGTVFKFGRSSAPGS